MVLQKTIEKDDLLARKRIREVALFGLIVLAAVLAQIPHEILEENGINRDYLLGMLGCSIVLGLFLYLKFFFFLAVVLMILGANLDQQFADQINISKIPLILALLTMVGISLINYAVKLIPSGLEVKPKEKSIEGVRALFYAIEKSNLVYAEKVLRMNFDPNLLHDNGYTALAYAAMKGNDRMVGLLIKYGADPSVVTKDGDTPGELALRLGYSGVADILKTARQAMAPGDTPAAPPEQPSEQKSEQKPA